MMDDFVRDFRDLVSRVRSLEKLRSGIGFLEITATTYQALINRGYISNNASQVVITLPATAPLGSRLRVVGYGAGGWKVAQNAGQTIHKSSSSSTTGTGGYIQSGNRYDAVELVCVVADTDWVVTSSSGTLTVA